MRNTDITVAKAVPPAPLAMLEELDSDSGRKFMTEIATEDFMDAALFQNRQAAITDDFGSIMECMLADTSLPKEKNDC